MNTNIQDINSILILPALAKLEAEKLKLILDNNASLTMLAIAAGMNASVAIERTKTSDPEAMAFVAAFIEGMLLVKPLGLSDRLQGWLRDLSDELKANYAPHDEN